MIAAGALKALVAYEECRPRVIRATKDWNWRPLVSVLEHEDVSQALLHPAAVADAHLA